MEWDVIEGAPAYGAFAGLLAGVAFVALTLIITRQIPSGTGRQRRLAQASVGDFFLAFLTLSVSALSWTTMSGTDPSEVPKLGMVVAGSATTITMAIGTLQMVRGLCHLVMDFEAGDGYMDALSLQWVGMAGYAFAAALGSFYLAADAVNLLVLGYLGTDRDGSIFVELLPLVMAVIALVAIMHPMAVRTGTTTGPIGRLAQKQNQWRLSLVLAIVTVFIYVFAAGVRPAWISDAGSWSYAPSEVCFSLIYLATLLSVMVLFVAQGWSLRAWGSDRPARAVEA